MKLIDTHTHLYLEDFKADIEEIILRAQHVGVEKFYLPAIDSSETANVLELEKKYPGVCFAMAGLHPCSVKENYEEELDLIKNSLAVRKYCGIGETGLDFYWDRTFEKEQFIALEKQLEWALEFNTPIILHTRNATDETIKVVKPFAQKGVRGIFHCFGGTKQNAIDIIEMGFYMGIGGVVTYKNSGLDKVLLEINCDNLVLETDAPYLTPAPFRGKRNESSYLPLIAEKIATIYNLPIEEIERITTENAEKLFGG